MTLGFQTVPQDERPRAGLWVLVLLCVSVLFGASTAQACHAHDAVHAGDGKVWVSAPADECPLCAATHVAMPAATQTMTVLLPQSEGVLLLPVEEARVARWHYEMFGRPPPERETGVPDAGDGGRLERTSI